MAVLQREGDHELVQRCITEGPIDVHPRKSAVIVHYDVEAIVVSEYGEPMVADIKKCTKVIRVKNLTEDTDIQSMAWQIVSQCEIISPKRLPELEQILAYLQNRKDNLEKVGSVLEDSSQKLRKQMEDLQQSTEEATMSELESYLEFLYDDLQAKIRGTGLILQLARTPENLLKLADNDSVFLALARVLRDDWKKSIDLTSNIVYVFFCFSTFSLFHATLLKQKIGSMCMTIVDYELKRHNMLLEDLMKKKRNLKSDTVNSETKKEYERGKKKYQHVLKKQETLLRVSMYLLLNLAEDIHVELKMRNKGLTIQLCSLLDRDNQELLILVISFLRKLSIFTENKEEMAKADIIKTLAKIFPSNAEILVNVSLRLLLNLSFDPNLRQEMVKVGLLPKLVALLRNENHRTLVLCILYHISIEEKSRAVFAYTDCILQVMKMIVECSDDLVDPETISLGINLASSPRNAQFMVKGPGLKLLMRRAVKTQDSLLLKLIRNISQHQGPIKKLFLPFLSDLGKLIKECDDDEVCVEALGILGNLWLPEVDFERVVSQLELMPIMMSKLKNPNIQDDTLLEVINVCGTFALDERCAHLLSREGLPDLLISVLKAKQEDDELVLQIVYVFHQLILHKSTRAATIGETQVSDYLLELMNDKNKQICNLCSKSLDIIAECDDNIAQKIKHDRFRWHNFQWLEMMTGKSFYEDDCEELDEDYLDPRYLHSAAELYDNPELFYEVEGQLEGAHGGGSQYELETGHSHDQLGEDFDGNLGYLDGSTPRIIYQPAASYAETDEPGGQMLSPQQYTMVMNSLQNPVSLYSSSLRDNEGSRQTVPEGFSGIGQEYNPMDLYSQDQYNTSPRYADSDTNAVEDFDGLEDYTDHPAFALMNSGHSGQGDSIAKPESGQRPLNRYNVQ